MLKSRYGDFKEETIYKYSSLENIVTGMFVFNQR